MHVSAYTCVHACISTRIRTHVHTCVYLYVTYMCTDMYTKVHFTFVNLNFKCQNSLLWAVIMSLWPTLISRRRRLAGIRAFDK